MAETNVSSVGKGWVQGYGDQTPTPMPSTNVKAGMGRNPGAGVDASGKVHGMAKGGKVKSRRTYLVGEKGPELFRPEQNGKIIRARRNGQVSDRAHARMEAKTSNGAKDSSGGKDPNNLPGVTS